MVSEEADMSKGGGGGAVVPPGLSPEELALFREQRALLAQSREVIAERKTLFESLLGVIGPQLGLKPVFEGGGGTPGEGLRIGGGGITELDFARQQEGTLGLPEDDPSFLRSEIDKLEALPATIRKQISAGLSVARGVTIPAKFIDQANPARARLANLRTELAGAEERASQPAGPRLVGFERIERPEEVEFEKPAAQLEKAFAERAAAATAAGPTEIETAAESQALAAITTPTKLEDLARSRAELGLQGGLDAEELNPFLARQIDKARIKLETQLRNQLGPGFRGSTPGSESIREFEEGAGAQLAQAAWPNLALLIQIAQSEAASQRAGIGQNVGILQSEEARRFGEIGLFEGLRGAGSVQRQQTAGTVLGQLASAAELPFGSTAGNLANLAAGFAQAGVPFAQQRQDSFTAALQNQQEQAASARAFGGGIGQLLGTGAKIFAASKGWFTS